MALVVSNDRDAILDVIESPETDYPGVGGCRVATRGKLAVVYAKDDRVVITLLVNGEELTRGRALPRTELRKLRAARRRAGG